MHFRLIHFRSTPSALYAFARTVFVVTAISVTAAAPAAAQQSDRGPSRTAGALNSSECRELLKECFAYAKEIRSHCFYSAAKHLFCQGSPLGQLAFKRWSFSGRPSDLHDAAALLGPEIVDQECVANFDNLFSGDLIKKDLSREEIGALSVRLGNCRRTETIDLSRP